MQCDSEKSKLYDWELKRSCLSRKHSILENEAKKGETKVTELINEINSHHHCIKSPNKLKATQMRLSNEFPIVNQFNDKNDVCQYVNTQDSDKNKQKSQCSLKDNSNQFKLFSTFSDELGDVLCSNNNILPKEVKIVSHREKDIAQFIGSGNREQTTKTRVTSEREINKSVLNLDDTLSDVPVKDCDEAQESNILEHSIDNNVNHILEELELELSFEKDVNISKIKNSALKKNQHAFNNIFVDKKQMKQNESQKNVNYDSQYINSLINLCNIPEEIEENYSNIYSESTLSKNKSQSHQSKPSTSPNK